MTALEFPGPGFSSDQLERLSGLATSLQPGQALWISGYFAGIDYAARSLRGEAAVIPLPAGDTPSLAPALVPVRALTILYGSETGNSTGLARTLAEAARAKGLEPVLADMADYKPRKLKDEQDLLIITSTHGEGDPPLSSIGFFEFIESRKAPRLEGVRYTVLALGDSTYENFCGAGKRLDARLAELGAERVRERVDCDVDYDDPAESWSKAAIEALAPKGGVIPASVAATATAAPAPSAFDKRNPFTATIIDNLVLTGRGSTKETRHVELSLDGSGLTYEPGDALGIMPRNDPALAEKLVETLGLSIDAPLTLKAGNTTLGEALVGVLEITAATPRFIDHWATLSGAAELEALRGEAGAAARTEFLRGNHIIDIVRRFPVAGIDAAAFAAGLRPLQPRLYSLASSLTSAPDEAHLTVSTVRYDLNDEPRAGVASGHLAEHGAPDATLPVYIQANPHFRLPENERPIIMVGAGTGVAPYRAFLQEREARGAEGKSWLFFGERNSDSDFLYQTEWQSLLKDGVLSRMSVAFSRDNAQKTYVQHRLHEEARDVYAWLEEGAHLYVCGDGTHLAPDVHATLSTIIGEQRGCGEDEAIDYIAALKRDHRYQIDVY